MLEERAQSAGLRLAEWVREVLLSAPEEPRDVADEVVLAELLALRSLFLNLHFRQGQAPLTEAEMRNLIDRADGAKMQRSHERLEAARQSAVRKEVATKEKQL